ncbi:hypothetical protein AVEN_203316-1 [Araneus ventricosus]|uniref:Uncharacterized protein n=1 Tax=Araneus ventricosus TaxID=182803 RepID=A0A4Y2MFZ2_ARAVE|nr:hypothetical protein AVEN_136694-1 [Araneus ventricosus]GBN25330.1 hypothetical protein AVEN_216210-1 [Araneus ventricosus]GBN44144.1 hypothetical protein AVEN_217093-1 [Araneus ventricosus]GBN44445.1 hypothetical protein AVEN_203316-1 [Araneus ventricosus]
MYLQRFWSTEVSPESTGAGCLPGGLFRETGPHLGFAFRKIKETSSRSLNGCENFIAKVQVSQLAAHYYYYEHSQMTEPIIFFLRFMFLSFGGLTFQRTRMYKVLISCCFTKKSDGRLSLRNGRWD